MIHKNIIVLLLLVTVVVQIEQNINKQIFIIIDSVYIGIHFILLLFFSFVQLIMTLKKKKNKKKGSNY